MENLPNFSFLKRTKTDCFLFNEEELIRTAVSNFINHSKDMENSFYAKFRFYENSYRKRKREENIKLFFIYHFNSKYKAGAKLRNKKLNHFLRPYWIWLCRFLDYKCLLCGRKFDISDLTVDHIIPLSKGGKHEWRNIQPLCKSCNSKKHNKIINFPELNKAQNSWAKILH